MRGWTTAHLLEPEDPEPATRAAKYQIRSLEELRTLFPQFFRQPTRAADIEAQLDFAPGK
jgi:pyrimidine and pyridine-specific 5'-nucleotidase